MMVETDSITRHAGSCRLRYFGSHHAKTLHIVFQVWPVSRDQANALLVHPGSVLMSTY